MVKEEKSENLLLKFSIKFSFPVLIRKYTIAPPRMIRFVCRIVLACLILTGHVFGAVSNPSVAPRDTLPNGRADTLGRAKIGLLPCDFGPELLTISSITDSSLLAQFHGKNVFGLEFQILDSTGLLRRGSLTPASSLLTIAYASLPPGKYQLRLVGTTCEGASEKKFSIPPRAISYHTPGRTSNSGQAPDGKGYLRTGHEPDRLWLRTRR